jgi:hypothetical protein
MGWTDSAADAENVLSAAWRCDARARLVGEATPLADGQLALRFARGAWLPVGAPMD